MRQKLSSYLVIVAAVVSLSLSSVYALTSTVAPAFARLTISSNKPQDVVNISVTNNNDAKLSYNIQIVDVDVSSGSLLPKNTVSEETKQLLQIQSPSITIEPKKSVVVSVTAKNFEKLAPGGHYAALKIESAITVQNNKNSNVQQAVSVPLFVVKEDGAIHALQAQISLGKMVRFGTLPVAKIKLKNSGNVDGAPRGFYSIIKGNRTLSKVPFNETSMPLFANQESTFMVSAQNQSANFFGKYTAVVSYRIDGQETPTIYTKTGWLVPWWLVGVIILAILLMINLYKYKKSHVKSGNRAPVISHTTTLKRRNRKSKINNQKNKNKKIIVSDFGSTKDIK